MSLDRMTALRSERDAVLAFCRDLDEKEWDAPSAAAGWNVQDVVAHLGATCRLLFAPGFLGYMLSKDIERSNDRLVDRRRGWEPARVLAEYERWSRRAAALMAVANRTPLSRVKLPLGELGSYPLRLFVSASVFDHHTHLHYDIAPALGRPAPPTDDLRMAVILEWMLAGLEQAGVATTDWIDRPIALTLDGPGGGTWRIEPAGAGRLRIRPGGADGVAAHVTGKSLEFPAWATTRRPWREQEVAIGGDQEYGTRFLDSVNFV